MSKIDSLELQDDESVLWTRRPEPLPILVIGVLWIIFFVGMFMSIVQYLNLSLMLVYGVIGIFTVVSSVHFWLAATQTRYIITDRRLFVFDGGIRPISASISRHEITDVRSEKGILETVLGKGRLVFKTDDNKVLTLSSLPSPANLAGSIMDHMPNAAFTEDTRIRTQAKGVTWPRSFADD